MDLVERCAMDLYHTVLKGAVCLDGADSVNLLHGSVELYCTDRCSTSTVWNCAPGGFRAMPCCSVSLFAYTCVRGPWVDVSSRPGGGWCSYAGLPGILVFECLT